MQQKHFISSVEKTSLLPKINRNFFFFDFGGGAPDFAEKLTAVF